MVCAQKMKWILGFDRVYVPNISRTSQMMSTKQLLWNLAKSRPVSSTSHHRTNVAPDTRHGEILEPERFPVGTGSRMASFSRDVCESKWKLLSI